ncbi:hypothetical protein ALC62_09464 [Cyphomyrmex costatus]|uniref:Uncharacterized protein n=1 Tax=Cyphomyrmex costatus TaxID=456900 RepID=A0A195CGJ0_9HYME|nr:hypothetical protein ALC62_09464 [Cyphomyrmex costatus]
MRDSIVGQSTETEERRSAHALRCVQDRPVREMQHANRRTRDGNKEEDNFPNAEVGTARRKRRFEKQFAAGKDEEIASCSVLPRAWMACESVQVAVAKGGERGIEIRHSYYRGYSLAEYVFSSDLTASTPLAKDGDSRKEEKGRSARVHRVTRSTIISREKEAEGPARRANRLDTEIRSPEEEGEVDYTRKSGDSGRGPGANAQSISRTRLEAIASVGGLRTVAATDRPTAGDETDLGHGPEGWTMPLFLPICHPLGAARPRFQGMEVRSALPHIDCGENYRAPASVLVFNLRTLPIQHSGASLEKSEALVHVGAMTRVHHIRIKQERMT